MLKKISHQLSLLSYSLRAVGPGTMVQNSWRWAADPDARNVDSGFDDRYGTDTNAELTPKEAGIPAARCRSATMYLPTMDADLEAMLEALRWPRSLLRQSTFVDLGSGKGRAVFLAAMLELREVVGVELSPVLHEIATRNLEIMHASDALRTDVRLVHGDAGELEVPSGPLITYLYHPFREAVAEVVVRRIVESLAAEPRPAAILYCHPTLQRPLASEVFEYGDMFRAEADGERRTRRFRVGWTIWSNQTWLEGQRV